MSLMERESFFFNIGCRSNDVRERGSDEEIRTGGKVRRGYSPRHATTDYQETIIIYQ